MRIALVGYGRMGKAIERELLERGHEVSFIIDSHNLPELAQLHTQNTDVAIEFTTPGSFRDNFSILMQKKIPMVCGTTGWYDLLDTIKEEVEMQGGSFLYAANFSIGVNILFQLNKRLAQLMEAYPAYDCFISEQHHRHKQDAPSGTAIHLGKQILANLTRKEKIVSTELAHRAPEDQELSVGFTRGGEVFGNHTVTYHSSIDTLTLTHSAQSRRGFAVGAVIGAEWLVSKSGFHEFSTLFDI